MSLQPNEQLITDLLDGIGVDRHKNISTEITERLRDAILNGSLPEGFVFPNENNMCKILDIGRSTLRECYSSLQILNLITRTKNGTFVNDSQETHQILNFDTIVDKSDFKDVMEFREIVEAGIVYNAALNCTPKDIETLNEILEKQKAIKDDVERLTEIDYEFHSTLAKISRNELLLVALNAVHSKFTKASHMVFENMQSYNLNEHKAIVEALANNDTKASKRAIRAHLKSISETVAPIYEESRK